MDHRFGNSFLRFWLLKPQLRMELMYTLGWGEDKEEKLHEISLCLFFFRLVLNLPVWWLPNRVQRFGVLLRPVFPYNDHQAEYEFSFHFGHFFHMFSCFTLRNLTKFAIVLDLYNRHDPFYRRGYKRVRFVLKLMNWHTHLVFNLPFFYHTEANDKRYEYSVYYAEGYLTLTYGRLFDGWEPDVKKTSVSFMNHLTGTTWKQVTHLDKFDQVYKIVSRGQNNKDKEAILNDQAKLLNFTFLDFDNTEIRGTAEISVIEHYRLGPKLNWLGKHLPVIKYNRCSLDFDKEVGPKKNDWKGGTLGISKSYQAKSLREAVEHCVSELGARKESLTFLD